MKNPKIGERWNFTQSFNGGEMLWMSYDITNPPIWHP